MKLALLCLAAIGLVGVTVGLLAWYWSNDRAEDLGHVSPGWRRAERRRQLDRDDS